MTGQSGKLEEQIEIGGWEYSVVVVVLAHHRVAEAVGGARELDRRLGQPLETPVVQEFVRRARHRQPAEKVVQDEPLIVPGLPSFDVLDEHLDWMRSTVPAEALLHRLEHHVPHIRAADAGDHYRVPGIRHCPRINGGQWLTLPAMCIDDEGAADDGAVPAGGLKRSQHHRRLDRTTIAIAGVSGDRYTSAPAADCWQHCPELALGR